jgi:hypothetical protein
MTRSSEHFEDVDAIVAVERLEVGAGAPTSRMFPGACRIKDRRGATCVTPRRLREERVLHPPARI